MRHYQGNEFGLNKPFKMVDDGLTIFENDLLLSKPGTTYFYSTYGWSVISAVMEVAAKQEFLAYMEGRIQGSI